MDCNSPRLKRRHRCRRFRPRLRPFLSLQYLHYLRRKRARSDPHAAAPTKEKPPKKGDSESESESEEHEFDEVYEQGGGRITAASLRNGIRLRYVQGLQLMMQLQCEALVRDFAVSPLICGVVGGVWMRFLAASRVFDDPWAKKAARHERKRRSDAARRKSSSEGNSSRNKIQGRSSHRCRNRKPLTQYWLRFLRKELPLHSSLSITFLGCHIARQSVLPNDIVKWAIESKLPYISAFLEVEKLLGKASRMCPLTSKALFRPIEVIGAWELEKVAAFIVGKIGLRLPPVNFYAIAYRYIEQLNLPLKKILPSACRVYEWSLPVELCLTANSESLPSRVYVMAVLVITIRLLYNINGQGVWESRLSSKHKSSVRSKCSLACQVGNESESHKECHNPVDLDDTGYLDDGPGDKDGDVVMENTHIHSAPSDPSSIEGSGLSTWELLCSLKVAYNRINDEYDYSKDFLTYLKYCKDAISAGRRQPSMEEDLMQHFWNVYGQKADDNLLGKKPESYERYRKRSREASNEACGDDHPNLEESVRLDFGKDKTDGVASLRMLKSDMEKDGFTYIPPRTHQAGENAYVQYSTRRHWGKRFFVAHADYYILLRVCAKLAEVDCRILHLGILSLEKRISWIEERIYKSLVCLRDNTLEDMMNANCEGLQGMEL